MSVLNWLQNIWRSEATHYVIESIPPERQDTPIETTVIQAEQHYLRVWLAEMFLRDDRLLFREFVPVVHSVVRLHYAEKPTQELPYVAGPQDVGLGKTLGKGIQLNHPLTNLLPFRGGTVSLSAGLFAYQEKDFFQGLSQVLHGVTGLLNVGQLSLALKVADSAIDGISNLLGAADKQIHLLYFQGFGGSGPAGGAPLCSGYTAVVSADASTFDKNKLFVKKSGLCFGDNLRTAKPLNGYDYMLLRIEASSTRDDYLTFDTFSKLLADAIREGLKNRNIGKSIIDTAILNAWSSPDLTATDRLRVAKALQDLYDKSVPPPKAPPPPRGPRSFLALNKALNQRILQYDIKKASAKVASLSRGDTINFKDFMAAIR